MRKISVVKIIDYCFQHESQLTSAYDDSNTMRYLSERFNITVVGRLNVQSILYREVENYKVVFYPAGMSYSEEAAHIMHQFRPDVIHMHGNHGWPQYRVYAEYFGNHPSDPKMIFSPAGSSCGTPTFLENFDCIIVNHPLQIERMKTEHSDRIVVRKRSADPSVFYPAYNKMLYDLVYVAGFVPQKHIIEMIDLVAKILDTSLVILGDFTRTAVHHLQVKEYIKWQGLSDRIFLHDFIKQTDMAEFLGRCGAWVWPNVKPENPSTTTNRSVIEALACGMPLVVGERAFKDTEFVDHGFNGFLYSDFKTFEAAVENVGDNLDAFRSVSRAMNENSFSFMENFVDFYTNLYQTL